MPPKIKEFHKKAELWFEGFSKKINFFFSSKLDMFRTLVDEGGDYLVDNFRPTQPLSIWMKKHEAPFKEEAV